MKKTISLLLAVLLLAVTGSLLSCGSEKKDAESGKDLPSRAEDKSDSPADPASVTFSALCSALDDAVGNEGEFVLRDDDYLENMMGMSPDLTANRRVLVTTEGGCIDEYGVFEVLPGKSAEEIDAAVKEYLSFYNGIWDDRYNPEEYPKLRDAEVRTFGGRFAVYAILSEKERSAVFGAAEKLFG